MSGAVGAVAAMALLYPLDQVRAILQVQRWTMIKGIRPDTGHANEATCFMSGRPPRCSLLCRLLKLESMYPKERAMTTIRCCGVLYPRVLLLFVHFKGMG